MVQTLNTPKPYDLSRQFEGKTVLVTGAGSGIGQAVAELFGARGAAVGVLTHTPEEGRKVAARISEKGRAVFLDADVRQESAMERAFDRLAKEFGGVDVVVANAGINGARAPVEELTVHDFHQLIDTNLLGTFLAIKHGAAHLRRRGGGAIVTVSSVDGNVLFNDPGSAIYAATKAGQVALTKVLAIELARHKIRINAVLPGSIDTEISDSTIDRGRKGIFGNEVEAGKAEIPLSRGEPGSPEQVARVIAFLASEESGHVTGSTVVVDGGQSLVT